MRRFLTTTALVLATAMPAYAQMQTDANGESGTSLDKMELQNSADRATDEQIADLLQLADETTVRATQLLGHRVYIRSEEAAGTDIPEQLAELPSGWESIGDVGDVIISPDGEIDSVALDVGGFFGLGEKRVQTSMDNLGFVELSGADGAFFLLYTGDRSALELERDFDAAALELDGFSTWSQQRETLRAAQGDSPTEEGTGEGLFGLNGENDGDEVVLTAEDLQGMPVFGKNDENLGEISELVLTDSGTIEHVIVDIGGFLGIGEKSVAIGFDDIAIESGSGLADQVARIDRSEDDLKSMEAWQG